MQSPTAIVALKHQHLSVAPPVIVTPLLTSLGADEPSGQNMAPSPPHTSSVGVVAPAPQMYPATRTAEYMSKTTKRETHGALRVLRAFLMSLSRFDCVLKQAASSSPRSAAPVCGACEGPPWDRDERSAWPRLRLTSRVQPEGCGGGEAFLFVLGRFTTTNRGEIGGASVGFPTTRTRCSPVSIFGAPYPIRAFYVSICDTGPMLRAIARELEK